MSRAICPSGPPIGDWLDGASVQAQFGAVAWAWVDGWSSPMPVSAAFYTVATEDTYSPGAERRVYVTEAEIRAFRPAAEIRMSRPPAEDRAFAPSAERRTGSAP